MARLVSGVLLIVWGVAVFASGFVREFDDGAYGAGQVAGWLFGLVLIVLGARAIAKGRQARN